MTVATFTQNGSIMYLNRSVRASMTFFSAASLLVGCGSMAASAPKQNRAASQTVDEHITPYQARFGRTRPVIAIVGENSGTELTDYVIPYGILREADVGEVLAVATKPEPMTMRPALRLQPQASAADFDGRYPEGADYVVVPAVSRRDDPALLAWIREQAAKGATLVSICDGALVVAGSGVMDGHRATAHWATAGYRRKQYPKIHWIDNRRYVADGTVVSSAGISAAIPTSLALVEAIAGHERAASIAAEIGASDWSPIHDSRRFHPKLGRNLSAFAATEYFNRWLHKPEAFGFPVTTGVDEVALAFAADAYSRTGRGRAYAIGAGKASVQTLHGLTVLLDDPAEIHVKRTVTVPAGKPALALDNVLADIARSYGRQTAYGVALGFEYPDFHD
ncbi:DJ-1/PfpI family protein [Novosphingobium sp. BL-8H]